MSFFFFLFGAGDPLKTHNFVKKFCSGCCKMFGSLVMLFVWKILDDIAAWWTTYLQTYVLFFFFFWTKCICVHGVMLAYYLKYSKNTTVLFVKNNRIRWLKVFLYMQTTVYLIVCPFVCLYLFFIMLLIHICFNNYLLFFRVQLALDLCMYLYICISLFDFISIVLSSLAHLMS